MLWVCIGNAADSTQRSLYQEQYYTFPDESTEAMLLQKTKDLSQDFCTPSQKFISLPKILARAKAMV